jgi:hypothetical protein
VGLTRVVASTPTHSFVGAIDCFGLYDTICYSSLFRVDLTTATAEKIIAASKAQSIAVSSDGHHLAVSTPDGIYVKTLP